MPKIERQLQGALNTAFSEVIKERNLSESLSPYTVIEEERADITIKDKDGKIVFFIELKDPTTKAGKSVFDSKTVIREISRCNKMGNIYFGLCNFINTSIINSKDPANNANFKDSGFFNHLDISRLQNKFNITEPIQLKLKKIANWYVDFALDIINNKAIKTSPIDELFIFKIKSLIEIYIDDLTSEIWNKFNNNREFKNKIEQYANEQQWTIPTDYEQIENLIYIVSLMLISKLIFYKAFFDNNEWTGIEELKIPNKIAEVKELNEYLWREYFDVFKRETNDFELLLGEKNDLVNEIAFSCQEIIPLVKDVIDTQNMFDFSKIEYDIIGRIFEQLIREDERHRLGQYFTPPNVIDLINSFCIRTGREKVIDPSCGSGTFLIRAYIQKKKMLNVNHRYVLKDIYGVDISSYAVYLSMLNLAIRDVTKVSYPRILQKDFFHISRSKKEKFLIDKNSTEKLKLDNFDAIIGNPPYTRQEDINTFSNKKQICNTIENEWSIKKLDRRSSIYSYFFFHAGSLLKENGYLGFVTSNSWLDVDYGKKLQDWILTNFEVVAIIASGKERFFSSADINTNITILKRQSNDNKRDNNIVKFVYFKDFLTNILKSNRGKFEAIREQIETTNNKFEDDKIKITPILQSNLIGEYKWSKYLKAPDIYWEIINKAGKKLVNFKNVAKNRRGVTTGVNDFFYLEDVTDWLIDEYLPVVRNNIDGLNVADIKEYRLKVVRNGLGEVWLIEEEFLRPVLKTTKKQTKYAVKEEDCENNVVLIFGLISNYFIKYDDENKKSVYDIKKYKNDIKLKYSYVYEYIKWGEKNEIKGSIVAEKPSCKSRPAWWDLGLQKPQDMAILRFRDKRNWTPTVSNNIYVGDTMFIATAKNESKKALYQLSLNTSFSILQTELIGRTNLGDGLLTIYGSEVDELLVINKASKKEIKIIEKIVGKFKDTEIKTIFDELGSDGSKKIKLENVSDFRIEMDTAFLKLVGFKENEIDNILLDLYKELIRIINIRRTKPESIVKEKKNGKHKNITLLSKEFENQIIESKIKISNTPALLRKLKKIVTKITFDKKLQEKLIHNFWKTKFNEKPEIYKLENKKQTKIF